MNKLWTEIILIAGITVALFYFIERRYSHYKTPADTMMENFFLRSSSAEVLLVGNSHMIKVYEEILNDDNKAAMLGLQGIDAFQMRNLICNYVGRMKNLKLI